MSATNYFENALLTLIFNNQNIANIADGIASAGSLYISLHTADPGEGGTQSATEANYTGYSRVALARNNTDWSVVNNQASNAGIVSFPLATGGTSLVTHWGIGTAASGTGSLLLYGALDSSLAISTNIRPIFDTADLKITLD